MTRHGSGLGEGARGAYRERAGGAEGSNGAVVAAGGADGSNDASDAVTARRRASRSGHGTRVASRSVHGASSDVGKQPQLSRWLQ